MPSYVKIGGQYKPWVKVWQKLAGVWVHTPAWHVNYRGEYKLVHETRTPFYFNKTLANTQNYNLREDLLASGWNGTDYVIATVTIPVGVTVSASTPGFYAFSTGTTYPQDSRLILQLNGTITGKGGAGASVGGAPAQAGGPGAFFNLSTTLLGGGTLQGGGGGGGAGGSVSARISGVYNPSSHEGGAGGTGGAGGAGFGAGGSGGLTYASYYSDWHVSRGTGGPGGAGGLVYYPSGIIISSLTGGTGGAGGAGGSAGLAGTSASWYLASMVYIHSTINPTSGAPGGAAYTGAIDSTLFTGTILGYRG